MSTATIFTAWGGSALTLFFYKPSYDMAGPTFDPRGGGLVAEWHGNELDAYNHELLLAGGMASASLTFTTDVLDANRWFIDGLGRHMEMYGPYQQELFEGFVNMVSLEFGRLQAKIGPLMEITNRCSVLYTPILDAPTQTKGAATMTTIADDADSQDEYGVYESVLSGGDQLDDGTTDEASRYRDTYIDAYRWPKSVGDISPGAGQVRVTVEILGYLRRASRYMTQDTTQATCTVRDKITYVLADEPSGIFSASTAHIDANAALTNRYEEGNRDGLAVIQELAARGDGTYNSFAYGMYEDRQFYYAAIPGASDIDYAMSVLGNEFVVKDYKTEEEYPAWLVRPGVRMWFSDFLASESAGAESDPRNQVITAVRFSLPNEVQLSGSPSSRLVNMLQQWK